MIVVGGGGAVGLQWTAGAGAGAATSLQQSFQVKSIRSQSAASMSPDREHEHFFEDTCSNLVKTPRRSDKKANKVSTRKRNWLC